MDAVRNRWLAGVLVLCGLTSVGLSLKASYDARHAYSCLTSYAQEQARVSKLRGDATAERDEVEARLLDGVTGLVRGPKQVQRYEELKADYRAASAKLTAERQRSPLPEFPVRCADVG